MKARRVGKINSWQVIQFGGILTNSRSAKNLIPSKYFQLYGIYIYISNARRDAGMSGRELTAELKKVIEEETVFVKLFELWNGILMQVCPKTLLGSLF